MIEERYSKYKEIMDSLQQQLEESKHRLEDFRVGLHVKQLEKCARALNKLQSE